MRNPLVTLTTDFGTASPYVAAMKGVLLGVNPNVCIVDLTHVIPHQDVQYAAFFLAAALPYFPPSALHVVVVDPGVGTERAILYVEVGACRLLAPDNGCWTWVPDGGRPPFVVRVTEHCYWRPTVSDTFHGRDIFAPVAGHLSLGIEPHCLGPVVSEWVRLPRSVPQHGDKQIRGEVVFVDGFGNLITNIPQAMMAEVSARRRVVVGGTAIMDWVRTYGSAPAGLLVALFSSEGQLEVALVQGNAAKRLGIGVGDKVVVEWE